MRAREWMAARKSVGEAEPLRARHNPAFHGAHIRDERAGSEMRGQRRKLREIGSRGSGKDEEIGHASDVRGAQRRIVEGTLLCRKGALSGFR